MILFRTPPWIEPMVTIPGTAVISTSRAMIVCNAIMICDDTTMGSTPPQGLAPWVCTPVTVMRIRSAAAMVGPERY